MWQLLHSHKAIENVKALNLSQEDKECRIRRRTEWHDRVASCPNCHPAATAAEGGSSATASAGTVATIGDDDVAVASAPAANMATVT